MSFKVKPCIAVTFVNLFANVTLCETDNTAVLSHNDIINNSILDCKHFITTSHFFEYIYIIVLSVHLKLQQSETT